MSSLRNPVGPLPPSVYWRRRLLVIGVALALVLIVVLIAVRPGGSAPPADPAETDPPTAPVETASPEDLTPCTAADIELTAVTDKQNYAAGEEPELQMRLANVGAGECSINVGTTQQEFLITSGTDRIWSTQDCQLEPQDQLIALAAGASEEIPTAPFAWDRTRSSAANCDAAPVAARPGWYHLTVRLGEFASAETRQFELR